jgi:hypothetical protein
LCCLHLFCSWKPLSFCPFPSSGSACFSGNCVASPLDAGL